MDDKEALDDIKKGGEQGFLVLYRKYVESLQAHLIAKHRIPKDDVEDVLQDIFVKFLNSLPGFRRDCSVLTWLYWITKSVATDYWRKKQKQGYPIPENHISLDDQDSYDSIDSLLNQFYQSPPEKGPNDLDIQICLERAFEQLQRQGAKKKSHLDCLIALIFKEQGFTIAEISEKINKTNDATRRYLSNCRKKLREYQPIKDCWEFFENSS
jgi:RNA polymerase sigma factor (sigma-70 family)